MLDVAVRQTANNPHERNVAISDSGLAGGPEPDVLSDSPRLVAQRRPIGATLPGNAQTADLGVPEPRPPVELPILPHNAPFSASVRQDDWWLGPVIARMRRAPRIAGTWRVYGE